MTVPLGHTRAVNPRHAARMDALAFAYRLIGASEEFWLGSLTEGAEEAAVTVHGV